MLPVWLTLLSEPLVTEAFSGMKLRIAEAEGTENP